MKKEWTDEVKMEAVDVSVKGSILSLFPAFKIEKKLPDIRVLEALNIVEDEYKEMAKKPGRNPETCHQTVLGKYPSRLAVNEKFKELADTDFKPEHRYNCYKLASL